MQESRVAGRRLGRDLGSWEDGVRDRERVRLCLCASMCALEAVGFWVGQCRHVLGWTNISSVIRVVRVLGIQTQNSLIKFGFPELIPEQVLGFFEFRYFGSVSGFGYRVLCPA